MRSIVVILYIVCFGCYVLFTRQPDYFDSEKTVGVIAGKNGKTVAVFSYGDTLYNATVLYPMLHKPGKKVAVIYEISDPSKAKQYTLLGYWITVGELVASLLIAAALYWVAVSVTRNPTPEALIEELEMGKKKPKKPKYDL